MVPCAYCERPLICESCGADYEPPDEESYARLGQTEETVICPKCEEVLVCKWCKTEYDGPDAGDEGKAAG